MFYGNTEVLMRAQEIRRKSSTNLDNNIEYALYVITILV